MKKYIDAEKLYEYLEQVGGLYPRYEYDIVDNIVSNVIGGIKTFIGSHQQELRMFPTTDEEVEVDVEKALDEFYKNADFGPSEALEYEIHKDIARHFYELGLNARKED